VVPDSVLDILLGPFGPLGIVVLYVFLQIRLLRRGRGLWRALAVVPAVAVAGAVGVVVFGVAAGSNLAPIWLVFVLPPATLWLVVLWLAGAVFGAWGAASAGPQRREIDSGL
jgi:hypothetical protein